MTQHRMLTEAEIESFLDEIRANETLWSLFLQKERELHVAQGGDPDNVKVELPMPTGLMILQEYLERRVGPPLPFNYTTLYIKLRRLLNIELGDWRRAGGRP